MRPVFSPEIASPKITRLEANLPDESITPLSSVAKTGVYYGYAQVLAEGARAGGGIPGAVFDAQRAALVLPILRLLLGPEPAVTEETA